MRSSLRYLSLLALIANIYTPAYALDPISSSYTDDSQVDITRYQYAAPGVLYRVQHANGRTEGYSDFTLSGQAKLMLQSNAPSPRDRYIYFAYDNDGHLITFMPPDSNLDASGRVLGSVTQYRYNAFGERIAESAPEIGTINIARDVQGNPTTIQDSKGTKIQMAYDLLNRPTQKTITAANGTVETVSYAYDATKGYPSSVMNNTATLVWTWAATGEMTSLTQTVDALPIKTSWVYDTLGRAVQQTLPSGNLVNTSYNTSTGLLDTLTVQNPNEAASKTIIQSPRYVPFGGMQGWTWGNGKTHLEQLNMQGQAVQVLDRYAEQLQYGSMGQITQRSDLNPSSQLSPIGSGNQYAYSYDAQNRLMQFSLNTGSNTTIQNIDWDVDDNRHDDNTTFYPKNGAPTQQWLSQNNQAATYDATGNLIQLGTRRYSYNAQNQLTDASDNGSLLGQYSYGPNGFRVKKVANAKTSYFLYLPSGELLGEYETATGGYHVDAEHVYLRGMPIATLTGGVGSDVMPTTGTTTAATAQKIAQLQSKLASVEAQAALKEAQLQQQLTDEIAQAAQKKSDLQQQLDTLLADASAQQASIQNDINTLLADTAAQVADLQNQISTLLADAATQTAALQAALASAATPKEATKIQKQLDNLATKTTNQGANLRDKLAKVQDKSATKEASLRDKLAAVTEKKATQEANLRDRIAQVETNAAQKEQKLQASLAKVDANEARRVLAISDRIARLQAQGGGGFSVAAMDLGFVHTDAIGTPRKITRAADNSLLWSLSPDDAWGGNLPGVASTITYNLRFAGQYYDQETGLHNNGYRVYCPACGRYLQPDPIGLAGGMHRYDYVAGDPTNKTDSLGLAIETAWDIFNVGLGVSSLADNLYQGNYGSAAIDALGLGYDGFAAAVPFLPAGASSAMKAYRAAKRAKAAKACEVTNSATTRFVNGVKVVDQKTGQILEGTVDLKPTLDRIKSGDPFPHRNDGTIFKNNAGDLPPQLPGYYKEYVHPTPGIAGPGPQRVVTGQGGEIFYTPDHYETFIPLH